MSNTLRTNQLKQLNYLDKAITNLTKALAIGEKEEQLGYNNGRIAVRAKELLEIYENQFAVQADATAEHTTETKSVPNVWARAESRGVF